MSLSVQPTTAAVEVGNFVQLTATARDARGRIMSDRPVTWASANAAVASVSSGGLVAGVLPGGPVSIRASVEGASDSAAVIVVPVPVASVVVTPLNDSVMVGRSLQLTATLRDAQGRELSGRSLAWESANPAVANVSSNGVVTAVAVGGPVVITALSEGRSGTAAVVVTPVPVASVKLAPTSATIQVGEVVPLIATMYDSVGQRLSSRPVTWTSSAPDVASVSSDGVVTGIARGGPTSITATSEGKHGNAAITVIPAVTGVLIEDGDLIGGEIHPSGDVDRYVFDGVGGDVMAANLATTAFLGGGCWDPVLNVYKDGQRIVSASPGSACNGVAGFMVTLPSTGKYLIQVSDGGWGGPSATAAYNLALIRLSNPVGAKIAYNDLRQDSIPRSGYVAKYVFVGSLGDPISARVATTAFLGGGCWDPVVALYKDGQRLASATPGSACNGSARLDVTLPSSGAYLLLVSDGGWGLNTAMARYNLSLQRLAAASADRDPE